MNITSWEKLKNDLAPGKHGAKQILLFLQRNVSAMIMTYLCKKIVSRIYTVTSKAFSKTDLNWLIKNSKLTSKNKCL